jgi:hypothetical protein
MENYILRSGHDKQSQHNRHDERHYNSTSHLDENNFDQMEGMAYSK